MTKLDNVDPSLTNRHDEDVFFEEADLSHKTAAGGMWWAAS